MTRALQISIACNVALAAACSFLFFWNQQPASPAPVPGTRTTVAQGAVPDWKKLDSPDFQTFVSNLRSAGCPEATIRDIITGEVTEIYSEKELQKAAAQSQSNGATSSPAQAQSIAGIQAERDRTIAALLDPEPARAGDQASIPPLSNTPGYTGADTEPPPSLQRTRASTYPAVFAHNAAAAANSVPVNASANSPQGNANAVSPAEQLMLDKINNDFVNAVGGPNQDPSDPAYQERWQAAQEMSDAQFKKFFGGRAYVQAQIKAARIAAAEQRAAAQQ